MQFSLEVDKCLLYNVSSKTLLFYQSEEQTAKAATTYAGLWQYRFSCVQFQEENPTMFNSTKRKLISLLTIVAVATTMLLGSSVVAGAATYHGKYILLINTKMCVVTALKRQADGNYKPVRAMLTTTGKKSTPTPSGTFYMGYQSRWLNMIGNDGASTYEQYTSLISGSKQIYFHSVWYFKHDRASQSRAAFNNLGNNGSHACVRLSTTDAKWIYDNCNPGTKIIIKRSSLKKYWPMGKPAAIKVKTKKKMIWDPTDASKHNPYYHLMPRPQITVSKTKATVQYGKSYSLKSKVYAKDPNSFMSLTRYLKVTGLYKYSTSKEKYVKISRLNTKSLGTYRVKYYVNDPYGKTKVLSYKFKVVDTAKPTITVGSNKTTAFNIDNGAVNGGLLKSVTAKQPSASRTAAITVSILNPDGTRTSLSNSQAKSYKFSKVGTYQVTYIVKNKYDSSIVTKKTIEFKCNAAVPQYTAGVTTYESYAKQLTAMGFKITKNEISSTETAGTVLSTDPVSGTITSDPAITVNVAASSN
jgi:hypothetical protein